MYLPVFLTLGSITLLLSVQGSNTKKTADFTRFQLRYLSVLSIVLLSDWLQGSYQYSLYKSYGYQLHEIAEFFVLGFSSSAVIGTFIGSISDRLGRKTGSLLYCVLYFGSCMTKLSPKKEWILVGRLLGGVSTSLLFSVFEAWMVSTHKKLEFEAAWMDDTFAWGTFLNGFVAILSGIIANVAVDQYGLVAPFMIAGICCVVAFCMISFMWDENYGEEVPGRKPDPSPPVRVTRSMSKSTPKKSSTTSNGGSKRDSSRLALIWSQWNWQLTLLGSLQTVFEASMYIFVFLWSPVLEKTSPSSPPFGLIFSTFMVCIMLGSFGFQYLRSKMVGFSSILVLVFALASVSFVIPMLSQVRKPHVG
jgi:hypothetical protein